MTDSKLQIRPALVQDIPLLLSLVGELAEFEKLAHEAVATHEDFERELFGSNKSAEAVIAEYEGATVGFALFFTNFSTFLGKRGLYLEDLFVRPAFRSRGFGEALFRHLASLAVARGCGRFEWSVLDWNENALRFYRRLGAVSMSDWTVHRLTGETLERLSRDRV